MAYQHNVNQLLKSKVKKVKKDMQEPLVKREYQVFEVNQVYRVKGVLLVKKVKWVFLVFPEILDQQVCT